VTDFIERSAKLENPNRREVLKTVTTLSAESSLAGISGRGVEAAGDPGRSPALVTVDQALREAVVAGTVGGVVAVGATENGIVYEGAFGPSMAADSVYWIWSMTKAITAAACMQLVEQGKLQLDQPMANCCRSWKRRGCLRDSTQRARRGFAPPGAPSHCVIC
jgi:methyl acetate hydrolase